MINNDNQSVFMDEISEIELKNRIASAKGDLGAIPKLKKHAETFDILYHRYKKLLNKEYLLNASFDELD
jgi:hypothetical protein